MIADATVIVLIADAHCVGLNRTVTYEMIESEISIWFKP